MFLAVIGSFFGRPAWLASVLQYASGRLPAQARGARLRPGGLPSGVLRTATDPWWRLGSLRASMPKPMPHPTRGSRSALRHLPNALSLFRLACGPILVAAYWETRPDITFCGIFMLAGLSDGADGYLARRLDLCSIFGAELDGRADTAFYSAMVVVSLRWYAAELRHQLPLILATVLSHLLQWAVAYAKFGRLAAYHSVTGKLWGSARRVEIELAGHRRDHNHSAQVQSLLRVFCTLCVGRAARLSLRLGLLNNGPSQQRSRDRHVVRAGRVDARGAPRRPRIAATAPPAAVRIRSAADSLRVGADRAGTGGPDCFPIDERRLRRGRVVSMAL